MLVSSPGWSSDQKDLSLHRAQEQAAQRKSLIGLGVRISALNCTLSSVSWVPLDKLLNLNILTGKTGFITLSWGLS